jgi:DNA-binding phage protein
LSQLRQELREVGRRRREIENERTEVVDELAALVHRARDAGLGVTEIARESGLSREVIYKLLRR